MFHRHQASCFIVFVLFLRCSYIFEASVPLACSVNHACDGAEMFAECSVRTRPGPDVERNGRWAVFCDLFSFAKAPVPIFYESVYFPVPSTILFRFHSGLIRRCYSCRSRGEKGDCKDPFRVNTTLVLEDHEYQRQVGMEAIPCASGWCGKIVDGGAGKDG
jgi:hypothetical protein